MGYAGGRAATAAGGGLSGIGNLLFQLAQQKQAEERYANDPLRRLQTAVTGADAAHRYGLTEGPAPELFTPAPFEEVAPGPTIDPRLMAPTPPRRPGLNPSSGMRAPGLVANEPLPKVSTPEAPPPSVVPRGEFAPDPAYTEVPGSPGFHMMTPDALEERKLAPVRRSIGAIVADRGLKTPEGQEAAAHLISMGQDVGSLRRGLGPQEPVFGTPEWEAAFRAQQAIIKQFRADPNGGTNLSPQYLIGLRTTLDATRDALARLEWMKVDEDPEIRSSYAGAKNAALRQIGWENESEYLRAARAYARAGMGVLGVGTEPDDALTQQRMDWDDAAAVARARGLDPEMVLGPRP